jgi:3-phenylpropionate/trans-cinnamate dioxygenase ferredoxin reductase subunit
MIGEEPDMPYHRPPLSKAHLAGEITDEALLLRGAQAYERAGIECRFGVRVNDIDRVGHRVQLSDGQQLSYTKLALATGGRPNSLPTSLLPEPCENVHRLYTKHDAEVIRRQLAPGANLVVIGAGYIGLETAASAVKLGLNVTVIERLERVLARVTAPQVSTFFQRIHRQAGVDLRVGVGIENLEIEQGRVRAVRLGDGALIPVDVLLVGIGQLPNTDLAKAAGLALDNGIAVDEFTQTSDPDIVAIGDCCSHPSKVYERRISLASVPNAVEQARVAAATLCGKRQPYNSVPWFWSDQYDVQLKIVGLSQGYDRVVLRGHPDTGSFAAFYLKGDFVISADTINRPAEFMLAKRLVAGRIPVNADELADESIAPKNLLGRVPA